MAGSHYAQMQPAENLTQSEITSRSRPRRSTWTLVLSGVMAAGIAAIAVGLVVSAAYDRRLTQLAQEAAALKQEAERQQSVVALLRDPATQVVALSGLEPAPGAKARMLWHATAGGLLVAQGLPPAISPTSTSPVSGKSRPATRRSSVDFPQPLGPTNDTSSPAAMENEIPSSARRLVPGASGTSKLLQTW